MNNAPIITRPKLNDSQVAAIDLLKEALAEALEGRVYGAGIVLCMDGGWATVMCGNRPGDLNLGCDDLKRKIIDAVTGGNVAKPKPSNILKARLS